MLTTELVSSYRKIVNKICWILLIWILLILGTICGVVFGFANTLKETDAVGFAIPAALVGGLVSLLVMVLFELFVFAPVLVLFEIDAKLDLLNQNVKKLRAMPVAEKENENKPQVESSDELKTE